MYIEILNSSIVKFYGVDSEVRSKVSVDRTVAQSYQIIEFSIYYIMKDLKSHKGTRF